MVREMQYITKLVEVWSQTPIYSVNELVGKMLRQMILLYNDAIFFFSFGIQFYNTLNH